MFKQSLHSPDKYNELEKDLKITRAQLAVLEDYRNTQEKLEKEVRLLKDIILSISNAGDLNSALAVTLEKFSELTNWVFCEAWIPSSEGLHLVCVSACSNSASRFEAFRQTTMKCKLLPGQGMPGQVYLTKKSIWLNDASSTQGFLRASCALREGLKAGFWVPIIGSDEKVIAVLGFLMDEIREEDKQLTELVLAVAEEVGSVFHRKKIEKLLHGSLDTINAQNQLFESILSSMPNGVVVTDKNGKFLFWNKSAIKILGRNIYGLSPERWVEHYGFYNSDKKTLIPRGHFPMMRALRGENVDSETVHLSNQYCPEGKWVTVSASPLKNSQGNLLGSITIFKEMQA